MALRPWAGVCCLDFLTNVTMSWAGCNWHLATCGVLCFSACLVSGMAEYPLLRFAAIGNLDAYAGIVPMVKKLALFSTWLKLDIWTPLLNLGVYAGITCLVRNLAQFSTLQLCNLAAHWFIHFGGWW